MFVSILSFKSMLKKINRFNGWQRIWFFISSLLLIFFIIFYIYLIENPLIGFEKFKNFEKDLEYMESIVKGKEEYCKAARNDYSNSNLKEKKLNLQVIDEELNVINLLANINELKKAKDQASRKINNHHYRILSRINNEARYSNMEIKEQIVKEVQKETNMLINSKDNLKNKIKDFENKIVESNNGIKNIQFLIQQEKDLKNQISKINNSCKEINNELSHAKMELEALKEKRLKPLLGFLLTTFKCILSYLLCIGFLYSFGYGLHWIYRGFRKTGL